MMEDFLRMVWELKLTTIVMVTQLVESNKVCHNYTALLLICIVELMQSLHNRSSWEMFVSCMISLCVKVS